MRRKDAISMIGALLLTTALIGAVPQSANRGSIEGIVLRGATDDPASNIRVRLLSLQGTGDPLTVITDHQGKFAFQNLEAGDYRLGFESDGYVRQVIPGGQEFLKLAAGQALRGLTVRLTPTGTISGRIVDRSGQPIGNVPVRLTSETLPAVVTRSNDRGEYRFFYIKPGPYWVSAGQASDATGVRSHGAANRFDEEFDLTYFPGVSDQNSSRVLTINPGEELSGKDIVMGDGRVPTPRRSPVQRDPIGVEK
jgi:hypothetical protein